MASAWKDDRGWLIRFAGIDGRRHTKRLPGKWRKRDADVRAGVVEKACREVAVNPLSPVGEDLVASGIITEAFLVDLRSGWRHRDQGVDLLDAWREHPSTRNDPPAPRNDYRRYLDEFMAWSGVRRCEEVQLAVVLDWVEEMKARGWAFDTRRHALNAIKRAMMVATGYGVANTLAGWKLDRRPVKAPVAALSQRQLLALLKASQSPRQFTFIAVQGCCGLRPSEACRLHPGAVLRSGAALDLRRIKTKRLASVRVLPVPRGLRAALAELSRTPGEFFPHVEKNTGRFIESASDAAGVELTPKTLRKTFLTLAIRDWKLTPDQAEAYLGHAVGGVTDVSRRHYLADLDEKALRPAARKVEDALCLQGVYNELQVKWNQGS